MSAVSVRDRFALSRAAGFRVFAALARNDERTGVFVGVNRSGVFGVATVRLFRDALERSRRRFPLHELTVAFVALLPVAVRLLKLSAAANGALSKPFACILAHASLCRTKTEHR